MAAPGRVTDLRLREAVEINAFICIGLLALPRILRGSVVGVGIKKRLPSVANKPMHSLDEHEKISEGSRNGWICHGHKKSPQI